MHTKFLPVLIAGALLTVGAQAQDAAVATPSSPAAAQQPQTAQVAPVTQVAAPAPSQVIYSPRLPTPAELTSVAAAQGLSVEQVSQTANQVTAIYRNSAGQLSTIAYQLLPTAGVPATTVVVPSAAPTVVYQSTPSVVYYESYGPYWPRYYYPPVSLSLGFGYYHGWGHGGWGHGGYRGGWGHHR